MWRRFEERLLSVSVIHCVLFQRSLATKIRGSDEFNPGETTDTSVCVRDTDANKAVDRPRKSLSHLRVSSSFTSAPSFSHARSRRGIFFTTRCWNKHLPPPLPAIRVK